MIKVGEYVRTKNGYIVKITPKTNIFNLGYKEEYVDMETTIYGFPYEEEIVKHSKNIIDLIEVGDYVNGYPVRRIPNFNNELCNFDLNTMEWILLKDIDVYYNILTKEQYMQNCYKVERNEEC